MEDEHNWVGTCISSHAAHFTQANQIVLLMEEISPPASASDDAHDEPIKILVLETSKK